MRTQNKLQELKAEAEKWGRQAGRYSIGYDKLMQLIKVAELASELCNAVDAEDIDVGGHRKSSTILADLGPACDRVEQR